MTINLRPIEVLSNTTFRTVVRKYRNWDGERIFRLGFLVGLGWDARRIAEDKIIISTHNSVHRQVQRYGGHFRDVDGMRIELTQDAAGAQSSLARRHNLCPNQVRMALSGRRARSFYPQDRWLGDA
jgi:hypothetical protein